MIKTYLKHSLSALLLLGSSLLGASAWAQTVSFLANVDPDTSQTVFTVQIDGQQTATADLNQLLRPGGGKVLRVTSIHGFLSDGRVPPTADDYAVIFLGALSNRNAVRGFGAGSIALDGRSTSQINFQPGLFVSLLANESLVLRSQLQSNYPARIEVHGFLKAAN